MSNQPRLDFLELIGDESSLVFKFMIIFASRRLTKVKIWEDPRNPDATNWGTRDAIDWQLHEGGSKQYRGFKAH